MVLSGALFGIASFLEDETLTMFASDRPRAEECFSHIVNELAMTFSPSAALPPHGHKAVCGAFAALRKLERQEGNLFLF
jgi:hypothetical protein